MIKVTAPDSHFLPSYLDGKWWAMVTLAATRGFLVERLSDTTQLQFKDAEYLPLNAFLAAAGDGFTIENYPVFLSLDAGKYNNEVPVSIPGRSTTDEEGVETVLTWAQWGSSEHVDLTDGTKGIPLVSNYTALSNAECALLYKLVGYTLLSTAEYRDLLPVDGV
jgi:hypothetical protein